MRRGVGPELGVEVHLAHFGVVEPVHDHDVGGQMAVAIALRDVEHFLLAGVALLALDVAVGGLGQHGRGAGEQPIAGIDLVGGSPAMTKKETRSPTCEVHVVCSLKPGSMVVLEGLSQIRP